MKKATIVFNDEYTSAALIKENKDGSFQLIKHIIMPSAIELIKKEDVNMLQDFFREIKQNLKLKKEPIFTSIPSYLLEIMAKGKIDYEVYCNNPEELITAGMKAINNKLSTDSNQTVELKEENYYFDSPYMIKVGKGLQFAATLVKRQYIDSLINASEEVGLNIISIEPEGIALIRFIEKWEEGFNIFSIYKSEALLYAYQFGQNISMFNKFGNNNYLNILHNHGEQKFYTVILAADDLNKSSFSDNVEEWPIYINSIKDKEILEAMLPIVPIKMKSRFKILDGEKCFIGNIDEEEYSFYPIAYGLAIKDIYERMNRADDEYGVGDDEEDELSNDREEISDDEFYSDGSIPESEISPKEKKGRDVFKRLINFFKRNSSI